MDKPYDYRNCSSLFGYAAQVHERSGGICQLCGCGAGSKMNFDLWRQLTVEHLIGQGQGGYLSDIRLAIAQRFPDLPPMQQDELARALDAANTVTACSFCNASTSHAHAPYSMPELIETTLGGPTEILAAVKAEATAILESKRTEVNWKLTAVRAAFEELIAPKLNAERAAHGSA